MSAPRALVTGISGQDGSYLAELLLEQGYAVSGVVRGGADVPRPNLDQVRDRIELLEGDLRAPETLTAAVEAVRPDELYHLAAPTFVPASWERPAETLEAVAGATAVLLEAVRAARPDARVYVATSSEIFAGAAETPQSELTAPAPTTPYGVAKLAGHQLAGVLRRRHGMHVSCGITYNHESPRRPEQFVTRKVTRAAAAIKAGAERELVLGDVNATRDWSFAGDVVRAAWLMLQQEEPGDYVVASGVGRTVSELVRTAFSAADLEPDDHVRIDPALVRPAEPVPLVGDPTRARARLRWQPSTTFEDMIGAMVEADLRALGAAA